MTIYTKLLEARQKMGHFEKDGVHAQKWKYFKSDKVLEQVGDALAECGILFLPCQTGAELTTAEEVNKDGKAQTVESALVHFEMKFIDVETGDTLIVPTHGSARDYGDKALFKAQTLAIKYLFLRMFLKGEGDSDDPDAESTPPARRPAPPPAAKPNGQARPPAPPATQTPTGSEETAHWSRLAESRGNFDRSMAYQKIDEGTIKVALGSEDPSISLDTLLLDYASVGAAISAVLTYAKEHASS